VKNELQVPQQKECGEREAIKVKKKPKNKKMLKKKKSKVVVTLKNNNQQALSYHQGQNLFSAQLEVRFRLNQLLTQSSRFLKKPRMINQINSLVHYLQELIKERRMILILIEVQIAVMKIQMMKRIRKSSKRNQWKSKHQI